MPPSQSSTSERADPLRAQILDAVLAIVAREGFEGATIRRVAAEAGCSAGALQKRFATRSLLLRAACEHTVLTIMRRIAATHGIDDRDGTLVDRHRSAVIETLPLDAERRAETLVWMSYVLRAAADEGLTDLPLGVNRGVHEAIALELRDAQAKRSLRPQVDPDALADALLALADGIAIRMLYTPVAEHRALLDALDAGLAALLAR